MRKTIILGMLTKRVKRFVAIMLVTLMAVGHAFADEVTYVFSEEGYTNAQDLTLVTDGMINEFVSFTASKGGASNPPKYYTTGAAVRFYNGGGHGNSFTLVPAAGYRITGVTVNEASSNTGIIGFVVDDGEPVVASVVNDACSISGVSASSSLTFYSAVNSTSGHIRISSITVSYVESGEVVVPTPTFSAPGGNCYTTQTVSLNCVEPGAEIYYSINGGDAVLYSAPFTVSATTTVSAYAIVGGNASSTVSATYTFPLVIPNIAAFYAADDADLYRITGDMTFVYRNGRNIYVKDATGGLLIYDNATHVITTEYNEGDVFSGGVAGTRTTYNGLMELIPDLNTASGVAGAAVEPVEVTAAELCAHPEDYASQLVIVRDGKLAAGTFSTNSISNINFTQDGSTLVIRNAFKTVSATFSAGTLATVVGFVTIYNNQVQLYPRSNHDISVSAVPYSSGFESGNHEWILANGDNINKWCIGTATGFEDNKLYISSSNGLTNKYNVSAASDAHAYMYTELPASDMLLTFDCRTVGDADDYLQVSVLDEAPVAGTIPETYLTRIYGLNNFATQHVVIPASYAGGKYIVFTWHNNATGGTQAPAAIDNVTITATCTAPTNVAATVTGQTAVVTWDAPAGQTAWTVQYKDAAGDVWQTVNATANSVTLNNLSTETTYDVRVKASCGDESSLWKASQFYVPCLALSSSDADITIGTGSTNTYYAPFGSFYKNSWIQMIYPASYFDGPGNISTLSWQVNAAATHHYTTLKIYMGTTTHANNLSTTDWVPMDDLTLVYEGSDMTIGSAAGWETFTLSTPFHYNGEGNLVIVTSRTASEYKTLNYKSTGGNTDAVMYRWNDDNASYAQHPGTEPASGRMANLPNLKVAFTSYVCHDVACATPTELNVGNVTTNSATPTWNAGDAIAWRVGYKAVADADWTIADVTVAEYALTGLTPNTEYLFHVMTDCGTTGMSSEAAVNFTTVATCVAPENLTATATTHTVDVNWLPVPGVSQYEAMVTGNGSVLTLDVMNASQFDLSGLNEGENYTIAVRAVCGEGEYSEWSSIDFTMPTICVAPTGLVVADNGQTSTTITWDQSDASVWIVEYGRHGFTLGEGTQINVNANTAVLTGLTSYTAYDVYVKADCGIGFESNWSSVLTFKTVCGPITVTEENPWKEDFETITGFGNQAFDDCWATPEMTSFSSPFITPNNAATAHSGKNSAELKGNSGAVATLVMPLFANPLSELQFSYYGMVTGSTPGTMVLGYITNVEDASTFVAIQTIAAQAGSYNRAKALLYGPFIFDNTVPAGARIALRFTSAASNCSWNLDDFTVNIRPSCTSPLLASIAASNVSATAATIAWTDANPDNTAWRVYYKATDETSWMSADVTASSFTLTDLTPNTSYDAYVVTNCGTEESDATNTVSFTTSMLPVALPYLTDFSGSDWKLNNGACINNWTMGTPSNKDYSALYISNDGSTATYEASGAPSGVSAEKLFEMPADSTVHVSFDLESGGESMYDYMKVYLSPANVEYPATETNGSGTYTHYTYSTYALNFLPYLSQTDYNSTATSYQYKINLTKGGIIHIDMDVVNPAPNGLAKLVFWWRNDNSGGTQPGAIVSNLRFGNTSCMPVTNLTVSNVTDSSADLTWTAGASETEWNVAYKTEDATEWTTVTTTTTSYSINGLAGATACQVEVTPVCDGETAGAATVTFTTASPLPACPAPSGLTFTGITVSTAVASWTVGGDETAWVVEYQADGADDWTVASTSSATYAMTGLVAGTTYHVRVKAVCNADESSNYDTASFNTCYDGCVYTIVMHDTWGDGWSGNAIEAAFSDGTSQTVTLSSGGYGTVVLEVPAGETMTLTWTMGSYPEEVSYEIFDACGVQVDADGGSYLMDGQLFYTVQCAAVSCPAPLALSATEVDDSGASVITWFAGGSETSWIITLTPVEGEAITATLTSPTYTLMGIQPGDSYEVAVKAVCDADDMSAEVTTTIVSSAMVDIKLVQVYTNPSSCDLSNVKARITVENVKEAPIGTFEAFYQVNGGAVVHETVTPYSPLAYGQTYTYTFNTAPVFTESANVISAWVTISGETDLDDNEAVSGVTYLTAEQAVPYLETFPASAADNWAVLDNNMDDNTFVMDGNAIHYHGSDALAANDWIISPCVEFTPFTNYLISFDYKVNSPYFNEKVALYYGPSANPIDDYWVTTLDFSNTDYAQYNYVGYMAMNMENLHIAFKAESPVGTDGFSIDNVAIKKAVSMSVSTDGNGTAAFNHLYFKNGYYYAGEGEDVTLQIVANPGYHVSGIYVNNVLVRGENPNNAAVDIFTFTPESGDVVYVTFTSNVYKVYATVSNLHYTAYMDNVPGASYAPDYDEVVQGGTHYGVLTLVPGFHFERAVVNGMDCTDSVTYLGNGQYALTLGSISENKNVDLFVDLDSAKVVYTVLSGEGVINGEFVVDANTPLPAVYFVKQEGYSNLMTTIVPAPGYHTVSILIDSVQHNNIDAYFFEHIVGVHTVQVEFAKDHYAITTLGFGHGTVSEGVDFDYDPNITYTFTATPDTGYRIGMITRNSEALTVTDPNVAYTETLTNILENYNYEVMFVQNYYTVSVSCGSNGMISPFGLAYYTYGQDAVFDITADQGYYIASITVDGTTTNYTQADSLTSTTYTFASVVTNHTISATFAPMTFQITVNAGDNGAVSPATSSYVYGATPTFTITPNVGYSIVDVTIDGVSVGAVSTYAFAPLTTGHSISATFAAITFTITAAAGDGGMISNPGTSTVAYNSNKTYTISAGTGYHVSDVFVDGASVGPVNSYTFSGITSNHTIYAAFDMNEYTVTVNQPDHGSITPGTTTVLYGATPSFVITPDMGYTVTLITVNGSNVNLNSVPNVNGTYTYTFASISANQTITATMTGKTYTITASAGTNGSITPNGDTTVNYGSTLSYTITPENGYVIDQVIVDGMGIGAPTSYTFANVVANHTINASFKLAECAVPTSLYTTHIDDSSAILHWSHPTATSFDIQYKPQTGVFTSVTGVSGNSYQLTNLDDNTTYLWQVRANCTSNNQSEWSNMVSFTTDRTPVDDTGIEDFVKRNIKVYAEHQNVHILNNAGMSIDNVRIFDAYGRMVYNGAVTTDHEVVNLNVAVGTYIVNVVTEKGDANYKVTILR